jgi:tRNA nucleotidyltransferase (CCA-adding enzyme)
MKMFISEKLYGLSGLFYPVPLYVTGGYVRNCLMGLPPSDIDICSSLRVEDVEKLLQGTGYKCINSYGRLGTLKISCGEESYEYTVFRRDSYEKGHTPVSVEFCQSPYEDACRRDFTVNSIYYDIQKDEICAPLNGLKDIENKVIRASDPRKVFSEDGLRLLRMVRFASELNFEIDPKTFAAAKSFDYLIKDITSERIYEEFNKILHSDCKYPGISAGRFPHYTGFKQLKELGLLPYILPEIELSYGLGQREDFHKYDVFEHTAQTLRFSDKSIRLAAVLHDIGKGICFQRSGNFYGHENVGAEYAEKLLGQKGLKCSTALIEETAFLIRYHMYDLNCKTKENKIKLFIAANRKYINKLLLLKQADYLGCGLQSGIAPTVDRWKKIEKKMIDENTPFTVKELEIGGLDVKELGCPERSISGILKQLLKECVLNPKLNKREILLQKAERMIKPLKIGYPQHIFGRGRHP